MKADEIAAVVAIGGLFFLIAKSGALTTLAETLARAMAPATADELDQAARESRAYELTRKVIEKAKAP